MYYVSRSIIKKGLACKWVYVALLITSEQGLQFQVSSLPRSDFITISKQSSLTYEPSKASK